MKNVTFSNIRNVQPLEGEPGCYSCTMELDLGDGPEAVEYIARPGGGGICDAVLEIIERARRTPAKRPSKTR